MTPRATPRVAQAQTQSSTAKAQVRFQPLPAQTNLWVAHVQGSQRSTAKVLEIELTLESPPTEGKTQLAV